ncbi:phage portal protein [Halobacillus karajensis]|uniref:Phage portal protein, SPP1 family n=1 Tax=Halobacillus karajensis TaxID=195088 RepID=A0A059NW76_9BACI|nr:phage portal protein [Halobacillus karajensis]CDQ22580.1 phage portal protein, SPP1 family [Halobacillus karajensis]CDQ26062.1 phage portal protein, SPP1 family [Halobacillus karajensis]
MIKYFNKIKEEGISGKLIFDIIEEHKADHKRTKGLYERYKGDDVPIFKRKTPDYEDFETGRMKRLDDKVNNLLNNSFDAEIVDTKVGYLFGHPIAYTYDEQESLNGIINEFNLRNHVEDADSEWGKMASICGYGARLAYINKDKEERIQNIDPWEVVFLCSGNISEPEYSLRYYDGTDGKRYAEFYDDTTIHFFSADSGGQFTEDETQPHLFDFNPLFGLANNKELKGDAEKVLSLIDAYDRTLSDASNEIEQYRLAYLVLKGLGADEETLSKLKETGIFELFDEKDDVDYLTKDVNDQLIENHLDRLEDNILRFAKSVNFTDESFGGNVSGVAMKYKLMALENKCITMERKMTAALRYQYKTLFSAWQKRNRVNKDDYLGVTFSFTRNIPANIVEEAQVANSLKGIVSDKTIRKKLSFVDNPEEEEELMQEQEDEYMRNMPDIAGEDNEPGTD